MEEKIVVTNHIAQALTIRIIFIWNRGTIVPFSIRRTCFETCISRASSHEENNELSVNFSLCRNKVSKSCSNKSSSDLFANQIDRSVSTEKRRESLKVEKKRINGNVRLDLPNFPPKNIVVYY